MKNLCVFGASCSNIDSEFLNAAYTLGQVMAQRGIGLVFGGGNTGLMGAAARGVHDGGGRIIGVIPEKLNRPGVAYPFCGQLIVTPDMHTRKARMEELSDGFIALPGGYGTLEELMEVLTLNQLGYITAPVVILNTKGYYSDLIAQLRECVNEGFTAAPCLDIFSVAGTPEEAVQLALNKERPDIPDKLADAIRFAAGETGQSALDNTVGADAEIHVVHCVETGRNFMGTPFEGDAVEYLFTAAQLAGAELILLRADNVDDALVEYAEKNGIDMIIMGSSPIKLDHETIVTRLQRRLPNVEFDIIGQ